MYKLEKLELEEGKLSMLSAGYTSRLPSMKLFDWETNEERFPETLNDISEGWQVVLYSFTDFHRTSKIREIVSRDEKEVVFRTQTSVYKLTELE